MCKKWLRLERFKRERLTKVSLFMWGRGKTSKIFSPETDLTLMEEYSSKWGLLVAIVTRLPPSSPQSLHGSLHPQKEEPFCSGTKNWSCSVTVRSGARVGVHCWKEELLGIFSETEEADLEQLCGDVAPSAATWMHYNSKSNFPHI